MKSTLTIKKIEEKNKDLKSKYIYIIGIEEKFLKYENRKNIKKEDIHHLKKFDIYELDSYLLQNSLEILSGKKQNSDVNVIQKQLWHKLLLITKDNYVPLLIHFDVEVDEIKISKILSIIENDDIIHTANHWINDSKIIN